MNRILEELAILTLGQVDPSQVRRALQRARMDACVDGGPAVLALWERASREVGLRLEAVRGSVLDVAHARHRLGHPLVMLGDTVGGPALLVTQASPSRLCVLDTALDVPTWMTVADAALRLGVAPDAPLTLVRAHALLPLAPLASERVPHADHGHHGLVGHPSAAARLWELLRAERDSLTTAIIYGLGVGLLSLAIPVAVQAFVNTVAFGTMLQPLVVLGFMLATGLTFAAVLRALQAIAVEMVQRRLFARAALDLAHRFTRLHPQERASHHAPELLNRFFDIVTLQKGLAVLTVDGVQLVLQLVLGMALLAFYHPLLLAFDLLLALGVWVLLRLLGAGAALSATGESAAKYRVAAWLQEVARHGDLFASRQAAQFAVTRVEELAGEYLAARHRHWRALFRQVLGSLLLGVLANVTLLIFGGWLVMQKQLTLGQLVAAELVVSALVASLMKMGKYLETLYDVLAASGKLGHLMDLQLERAEGAEPQDRKQWTVLLPHANPPLAPAPGARVLLQEANHGAASAAMEALAGLTPVRGVEVAGLEVRDFQLAALRDGVVLLRSVEIFEGTVEDNLLLGGSNATATQLHALLTELGLEDELDGLPHGLHTPLCTHGGPLSKDGRLQLVVARALLRRPAVLLVDLPLETLSDRARQQVLAALFNPVHAGVVLMFAPHIQPPPAWQHARVSAPPLTPVGDAHAH